MSPFDTAWLVMKGYEAPTFTDKGLPWLEERGHSLMDGVQPISSFRNLTRAWKNLPMMSIQPKLLTPEGRKSGWTTLATSSTIPLTDYNKFWISRGMQNKTWDTGKRSLHAKIEGQTTRDILDQMLFDSANPQDLLDYDVEYNKHGEGMPIVLDREGGFAPLVSYWPFEDRDKTIPNRYGGNFVVTQLDSLNEDPRTKVRAVVPETAELVCELSVITPYGAAFPDMETNELIDRLGARVIA